MCSYGSQPLSELDAECPAPVGTQFFDSSHGLAGANALLRCEFGGQSAKVDGVMRAIRCQRQELHRHQVLGPGDGHDQSRHDLQPFGIPANLRLDATRGEQQVDNNCFFLLTRWHDSDRGQAAQGLLLERHFQCVTGGHEATDQGFGGRIIGDGHGDIDVACEARFDPH